MTPTDRSDPAIARLPKLAPAEHFFRLRDGAILAIGSEEVGAEESVTFALFDSQGAERARRTQTLWLGGGFLSDLRPAGPAALDFQFPAGVGWRLEVRQVPAWLSVIGLGPLRLRRT
jgi:hypothetical protein